MIAKIMNLPKNAINISKSFVYIGNMSASDKRLFAAMITSKVVISFGVFLEKVNNPFLI